jgi:hypothetical protein
MDARCPDCGRELDPRIARPGRLLLCECGRLIGEIGPAQRSREPEGERRRFRPPSAGGARTRDPADERNRLMEELKRKAERICLLILRSDFPEVDVAIERARLREWCEEVFPDRMDLYDMIYESRFDRLIEQFGDDRPGE